MSPWRNAAAPDGSSRTSPRSTQLGQPLVARERGDQLELERLARDGRDLGGRAGGLGELATALISTASRTVSGSGTSPSPASSSPRRPVSTAPLTRSAAASSSTKNGIPSVRSWIARASAGEGGSPSACGQQLGRLLELQRAQHELVEPAGAAQVVAQPPHAVVAREPVGAVGGDHQHRQLAERLGERGQQLERRLVGPLEVVEDDQRVPLRGDAGERAADRLEQRRAVGRRRRRAELGQQQRELRAQRARLRELGRVRAQVAAQRGHHRAVGSGAALGRRAAQDARRPSRRRDLPRAASCPRRPRRSAARSSRGRARACSSARLEPLALCLPTDQPRHSWAESRVRHPRAGSTAIPRMCAAPRRP